MYYKHTKIKSLSKVVKLIKYFRNYTIVDIGSNINLGGESMKNKKMIVGIMALVLIVIIAVIIVKSFNYKNKTITASNFETVIKEAKNSNLNDEEKTQFAIGVLRYTFNRSDIYGKKVKDIIEEGKNSNTMDIANNSTEDTQKGKLKTISNDFVTEIWNEVFCNISFYVATGTNSTGGKLDIEYTINKADNLMKQRDEYNDYINSLEGEEYSQIKYIWEKLIGEIDRMYSRIKEETPREKDNTYKFDTGSFSEYSKDFKNEIDKLK